MKMKRYTIMMSLATALLGLVSCSSEEGSDNMAKTADLQLTTDISTTRSIIAATSFSAGSMVELFVSGAANNINYAWAEYNAAGFWSINPTVKLSGANVGLIGLANLKDADITPDENGDQCDILIGTPNLAKGAFINAAYPKVPMTFHHALARISFVLKQQNGSEQLTCISLKNIEKGSAISVKCDSTKLADIAKEMAYVIAHNEDNTHIWDSFLESMLSMIYANREAATLTLKKTITLSEDSQTIDLLVVPTSINSYNRVTLELTIGGNVYSVELPYTTWSSNSRYVYPVTIDTSKDMPVAISVGSSTILDWSNNGEGNIENTWNMD